MMLRDQAQVSKPQAETQERPRMTFEFKAHLGHLILHIVFAHLRCS